MGRCFRGPNGRTYWRADEGGARRWAMLKSADSRVTERLNMFMDPIRQAVEIEMEYRGMSVHQLARASHVDPGHLRRWLRGWTRLSTDRASLLLTSLQLKIVPTAELSEHSNSEGCKQ